MPRYWTERSGIPYIAPFAAFIFFLAAGRLLHVAPDLVYPLGIAVVSGVILVLSRSIVPLRASDWTGSVLLGVAVFLIWIAPDVLWPAYRTHWLFDNPITEKASSSLPGHLKSNMAFLVLRVMGSVLIVPVLEELFWRGWMLRWLIRPEFWKVPPGAYSASAFWIVAILFASEHGPYWEVGLLAGIIYNWWIIRTKSLANCILAHAVTNACLAAYVLFYNQWQYWL